MKRLVFKNGQILEYVPVLGSSIPIGKTFVVVDYNWEKSVASTNYSIGDTHIAKGDTYEYIVIHTVYKRVAKGYIITPKGDHAFPITNIDSLKCIVLD